jgi:uncharacterized GH25 family protein
MISRFDDVRIKNAIMKKVPLSLLLVILFTILCSHEFWLLPDKFIYDRGEEINVSFLVGENFEGENWTGDSSRIYSLLFYYGGVKDEIPRKLFPGKGDTLHLRQYDEGTNMLTYQSYSTLINLEADEFNKYLEEDGLTDAIEYRKQHNETDSTGKELYMRSVKTIFQVGNVKDETYKTPTALPLDIIPQSHPYKHTDGEELGFKIFYKGDAFANSLVKVWHHSKGETIKKDLKTDENGFVKFTVQKNGRWMISCVKMIHAERGPAKLYVPWESYWGSCTWGYY